MQDNADLTRHFSEYELNMPYSPWELTKLLVLTTLQLSFQNCWDAVKNDIMYLFFWFQNANFDAQRLDYGIITLLPKSFKANKI
jgi:hypothetical protein